MAIMNGRIFFGGDCPGKHHNGPVSAMLWPEEARELLKMDTPKKKCSCGQIRELSTEAIDSIRRHLAEIDARGQA